MSKPITPRTSTTTHTPPIQAKQPTAGNSQTEKNPVTQHKIKSQIPDTHNQTSGTNLQKRSIQPHQKASLFNPVDFSALDSAFAKLNINTQVLRQQQQILQERSTITQAQLTNTATRLQASEESITSYDAQSKQKSRHLKPALKKMQVHLHQTQKDIHSTQKICHDNEDRLQQLDHDTTVNTDNLRRLQQQLQKFMSTTQKQKTRLKEKNQQLVNLSQKLKEAKAQNAQLLENDKVLEEAQEKQIGTIESQALHVLSLQEALKETETMKSIALQKEYGHLKRVNRELLNELEQEISTASDLKEELLKQEYSMQAMQLQLTKAAEESATPIDSGMLESKQKQVDGLMEQINTLKTQVAHAAKTPKLTKPAHKRLIADLESLQEQHQILSHRYDEMIELNKQLENQLNAAHKR